MTIKKGEIIGVTGLMGAGKTELGRAISGVDKLDGGVYIQGKKVRCPTPQAGIREGVAYLPEDRKTLGLIQGQSIRDNYALPSLDRLTSKGIVDRRKIDKEIREFMVRLAIKAPDTFTTASQLSGGNQQKVVVAKWLGAEAKVPVFDEPTRGIDINGKREIYQIMHELPERGVGILMLTSDYAEALERSHRILVMRRGAVVRDFKRGEANEEDLLREAIGEVTNMAPAGPALAVSAVV